MHRFWHVAATKLAVPALAEKDEEIGFASGEEAQAVVAQRLGFKRM